MSCFMCFSSDSKLERLQRNLVNETIKKITFVHPHIDISIPESKDPIYTCTTCLKEISSFHTIKKENLQNCRLKHFVAMLKGTSNLKPNELNIVVNNNEITTYLEHIVEIKVEPNNEDSFLSEDTDPIHVIKEEKVDDYSSHQVENDEKMLCDLKVDESSSSSNDSTENDTNLGSYEFVDVNKFTDEDSNLLIESKSKDKPKKRRGGPKKPFQCNGCEKSFSNRSILERHSRVHSGERPYKCVTCEKTFKQLAHLNTHKLTHTDSKLPQPEIEKKFQCTHCDKKFSRQFHLQIHTHLHTGIRPYKCPTCAKTFIQSAHLTMHKQTHTGDKPHECDICHMTFYQKSHLKGHKRTHDNIRPFKCGVCKKAFTQSNNLRKHMLIHTGEKPFQCHLCQYTCTQGSALKRHIRYHTGEKPYSCKDCEKKFTTSSCLKEHQRRIHSKEKSK